MNSKMWGISQVKSEINLGENYQINTRLNLKTRQKKHTMIGQMSWSNVL